MKKLVITVTAISSLLASANANLILNGGFETYTDNGNEVGGTSSAAFDNWVGFGETIAPEILFDLTSSTSASPGGDGNTDLRLRSNAGLYQDFGTAWDSTDTFTVTFNASEVSWKSGGGANAGNAIAVSFRSTDGNNTSFGLQTVNLDFTHDGGIYADWSDPIQNHSITFSGADLIAGGATVGQDLRLYFQSANNADSINYFDNVAVVIPEPSMAALLGVSLAAAVLRRRRHG